MNGTLVILKIQICTDMKLGVLILLSAFLSGGCVCPAQAAGAVRVCSCENNSEGGVCHKSELAEGKHDLHGDEVSKGARTDMEMSHQLVLKTNLLYDAALMPSLEVEYLINDRWSVNLEGEMAWWKNNHKHKYYQLATISPEGRYWFKAKRPWHGHYVGLLGGFSWYDLENGKDGYKGEAVMAGLSYGYMFPVSHRFSFEAGIGVGFMHAWYEEYLPIDGHYVYQQSSRMNYFGPLKLKFSLVWRLWNGDRKKGGVR